MYLSSIAMSICVCLVNGRIIGSSSLDDRKAVLFSCWRLKGVIPM